MTERTVQVAGITFRAADDILAIDGSKAGNVAFAQRGEVVDVHENDLERFDSLNDVRGPASAAAAFGQAIANQPPGPGPLDHGTGAIEDPDEEDLEDQEQSHIARSLPQRPRAKANLAEWQDYAEAVGVEVQDDDGNFKTKAELQRETEDLAEVDEPATAEDPAEESPEED